MKYSVIIPYKHSDERAPLLKACINNLINVSGGALEICLHDTSPEPSKLDLPSRCKYLFTEHSEVFHRAWAINRGVKKLATGDMLVLMDGDLIVSYDWIKELYNCNYPSAGWGKILWLNKEGTEKYLSTGYMYDEHVEKKKTPSAGNAAGGITVVPTKLFNDLKGIPEDFIGSWGGEDNAFWSKLTTFGNKFSSFDSSVIHLYHSPSTPRVKEIQRKALPMFYWNHSQWSEHIKSQATLWGAEQPSKLRSMNYISTKSSARLTMAMLSWIRPDKLIETLTNLHETLTFPVNLCLMVQGNETLDQSQRRVIRELSSRFYRSDVFFTKGNVGTGPARKTLAKRALHRFSAPYFNFSDDDTTFTPGSVEAAMELMDKDFSIGVVGIRYKPKVYMLDNHLCPRVLAPIPSTSSKEYVDSTGSASAIIRKEVFDSCMVDSEYKLGQWDLDFFLQVRSIGWKIVNYQAFSGMKAVNNWGGSPEYRRGRMDRPKINASIARFKQKWGLIKAV